MGKQIKKKAYTKPNKNEKICERCGNGGFTKKTVFNCKYCGWLNGVGMGDRITITKGGVDEGF